jgi:hypothetical protein
MSVYLPAPDANGNYRYADGSRIWKSGVAGKWLGCWANGVMLHGDNDKPYYFKSALAVAACLNNAEEGPSAQEQKPEPTDSDRLDWIERAEVNLVNRHGLRSQQWVVTTKGQIGEIITAETAREAIDAAMAKNT